MTLISGVERRRVWTDEQKRMLVAAACEPGASVAGELDGQIAAIERSASVAGHSVAIEKPERASRISAEAARLRGHKAAQSRARNKAAREMAKG